MFPRVLLILGLVVGNLWMAQPALTSGTESGMKQPPLLTPTPGLYDLANITTLALALSRDGRTFDRAFALRTAPAPAVKYPGNAKLPGWQYPNALVWREHLYVAYSVGKEDLEVLRVPLAALVLKP